MAKNEPKNSNVKMFKKLKKIKESEYSEPKNYWNKTKYICLYNYTEKDELPSKE